MQSPNEPSGQAPIPQPTGLLDNPSYATGGSYTTGQPSGILILVLGILGITICGICAPIAWIMSNNAIKEIDAGRGDPAQRGSANIGRIIGIIGTVLVVLGLLFVVVISLVMGSGGGEVFNAAR
jgi:uncharacterized membrane protein YjgN (DUF898 family)